MPIVNEHSSLCHCGTCQQAVKAAEKIYLDLLASDCPVWAFQVGTALTELSLKGLAQEPHPVNRMQMLEPAMLMVESVNEFGRAPTVLLEEGQKARKALWS